MSIVAYYEPRRLNEADFLAGFLAREDHATFLLHQLRLCADGDARHRLIVGPRGMGKTSILRRLQIGVRDDPELSAKLLPLTFREEQYNVRSLDRFWRNCGEALAEWHEDVRGDKAAAERLDRDMQEPAWKTPASAAEAFADKVASTGLRPVLLVDNLDLILDALPDQQRWQLRRILQAPRAPILFGAATRPPVQLGDPNEAFYEFFRWEILDPLTEPEMMACIRRRAAANPATGASVLAVLERAPGRLRVLHALTGGNPRILAFLYGLLERADSDSVHSDLETLLDQMTPLYKARVEDLRSDLQRAVFDAIALNWDPITTHDLSLATGVEVTGLSPQIARLRDFGLIEEVPTSGARAGYQLGERFFNIWYLMRHGNRRTKQRMRWLTAFMQTFYSGDELRRIRELFAAGMHREEWAAQVTAAADAAIERPIRGVSEPQAPFWIGFKLDGRNRGKLSGNGKKAAVAEIFSSALEAVERGHDDVAETILRQIIAIDAAFVPAWECLGVVLTDQPDRLPEAEQAFRTAVQLNPASAWPWIGLGRLLTNDLGQHSEAEDAFRTATRLDPNAVWAWGLLGDLLTDHLGRHRDAEDAYRTAINLPPGDGLHPRFGFISLSAATGRLEEASGARNDIPATDGVGQSLLDATIEVARDNFGRAAALLSNALAGDLGSPSGLKFITLYRLLRLFDRRGYGERLIEWFRASGHADSHAPIHTAFVALVRGPQALLDVNPEVRATADRIYNRLAGPRPTEPAGQIPRTRRGRPRRRLGA